MHLRRSEPEDLSLNLSVQKQILGTGVDFDIHIAVQTIDVLLAQ